MFDRFRDRDRERRWGRGRGRRYRRWGDYNRSGYNIERAGEFDTFGTRPYPRYSQEEGEYYMSEPQMESTEEWRIPGPYTGMGPSNWTGQDEWITDQINQRLMAHGQLDASGIMVSTKNGEVTLTGDVDSRRSKRLAEDIAESVVGVIDIHNQLKIKQKQQWK